MIYDCFAFFNELELLELRLHELDSVVDRFVLVEATRTFQKEPKPLYFEINKSRFSKFLPKIEHVIVDEYPGFFAKFRVPRPWDYDNHQKEQILRGLKNAKPDDWIVVSDLDEIPNPQKVLECAKQDGIHVFRQKLFYYYLNCWVTDYEEPVVLENNYKPWNGSVMLRHRDLLKVKTIKEARNQRDLKPPQVHYIPEGGWHFSYMGGVERVIQKIEAYAHTEVNKDHLKVKDKVQELMNSGQDLFGRKIKSQFVPIDQKMPQYLQAHQARFQHLIL